MTIVTDQIMAHRDVHILIPKTSEMLPYMAKATLQCT